MDMLQLGNYDHRTLVNNPPFITNNPVHEKMYFYKKEFSDNELNLFRAEHAKDKKDNKFIGICVLGAFLAFVGSGVFVYKKFKSAIRKIK